MKAVKLTILGVLLLAIASLSPYLATVVSDVAVGQPKSVQPVSRSIPIEPLNLNASTIAQMVNEYRASKGLVPLVTNEQLNASACAKADDMIANQYWSHNSPTGVTPWYWFDQVGYDYSKAGENLAYGYHAENAVVSSWINSPSHETNMSGNFSEQGMCARSASFMGQQTVVVVNHFGLR